MELPPGTDLSKVPIGPPPPGVIPNFVNPKSTAGEATAVTIVFTIVMLLFVLVRMYTKIFVSRSRGWDDCTCAVNPVSIKSLLMAPIDVCILACVS